MKKKIILGIIAGIISILLLGMIIAARISTEEEGRIELQEKKVQREVDIADALRNVNIQTITYGVFDWDSEQVSEWEVCYTFILFNVSADDCTPVPINSSEAEQDVIIDAKINETVTESFPKEKVRYVISERNRTLSIEKFLSYSCTSKEPRGCPGGISSGGNTRCYDYEGQVWWDGEYCKEGWTV